MTVGGMKIGEAFVEVRPDTHGFKGEAERSILGPIKGIALAAGGALAAAGVGSLLKDSIGEAREAIKVQKQTEAVLKSTGGVAGVTSKHIGDLATKLSNLAGVDDELIQSGENVLATFTNVKNGAGKGNDVFDQATTAALNMSAALGTDLQGSIIQVGKALNDPIKGVTALQRVGVSFTEKQKAQIKTLVDSGKTLDAQKLILKELGTEFGGAAAASADPMQKLGVVFKNLEETVGLALLPTLSKVSAFLANNLPHALDTVGKAFGKIKSLLLPIIANVAAQWFLFIHALKSGFTENEGTSIERFALILRNQVWPVVKQVASFIKDHFKPVLVGLGIAVAALISPWLLVVGAVAAAAAGAVYAYKHFATFRDTVDELADVAKSAFEAFRVVVDRVVIIVTDLWARFGSTLISKLRIAANAIVDVIQGALKILTGVFDLIKAVLTGKWGDAWDAILKILAGAWQAIGGVLRAALAGLSLIFEGAKAGISAAWSAIWHGLATLVTDIVVTPAKSAFDGLVFFVAGMPGRIASAAKGMFNGIKDAFKAAINIVIGWWNGLDFKVPKVHIKGTNIDVGGFTFGTPDIPKLAAGGIVRARPGGTLVLAGEGGRDEAVVPLSRGGLPLDRPLELHVHTKDDPQRIYTTTVRALRDAAFLLGA
jgi:hypothetical protein